MGPFSTSRLLTPGQSASGVTESEPQLKLCGVVSDLFCDSRANGHLLKDLSSTDPHVCPSAIPCCVGRLHRVQLRLPQAVGFASTPAMHMRLGC